MTKIKPVGATPGRILDIAERLAQTRGYNAFSYADIAESMGLTTASLHYHFPSKADLGIRLIERYRETFGGALTQIGIRDVGEPEKLRAYVDLYAGVLREERLCLCGMLAAEYATLPPGMQSELRAFFDDNERWLSAILDQGRTLGTLRFAGKAEDMARLLVGSLEGAMILARSYEDPSRFETSAKQLIDNLSVAVAA